MEYRCSAIPSAQLIVNACYVAKIKHVVVSPGSRNAPLILSFGNHPQFKTHSIPDERSAGYFALGMSRKLNQPVALICTSGTAVLNYAPAMAEAYYQEIPLVAITADRPPEWIDQEDGQTINQIGVFNNFVRYAANLLVDEDNATIKNNQSYINGALKQAMSFPRGPVHINIPFREPLYDTVTAEIQEIKHQKQPKQAPFLLNQSLAENYRKSQKVILMAGVQQPNPEIENLINELAEKNGIVTIAPPTANLNGDKIISNPEPVITSINNTKGFTPDLLITVGGPIVSKAAKLFFRGNQPAQHWDVDMNPAEVNTYQCLTEKIRANTVSFLQALKTMEAKPKHFQQNWLEKSQITQTKINEFTERIYWSDLFIYKEFFEMVDTQVDLHLANSTPVRYAELFKKHKSINYFGNRGTSGIDGSLSTAAGAAATTDKPVVLICGDLSFTYDSNALWNKNLPNNLTIILINNQGGNIFRIIPGPKTTHQLELFEAYHPIYNESICNAFNVNYQKITDKSQFSLLKAHLKAKQPKATVFEFFTDATASANNYQNLFKYLKNDNI